MYEMIKMEQRDVEYYIFIYNVYLYVFLFWLSINKNVLYFLILM